jgi:hypothetical protein
MADSQSARRGSLVAVGTGIRSVGQLTVEAMAWMKQADKLLYVVADPVAEGLIKELNPQGAESLFGLYADGKSRMDTYREMVERILSHVRAGQATCVALYGHPGVFAYPAHEAIRRARAEGYPAKMLPGISTEDCLFADLGLDPALNGCQSYEATDFLMHDRQLDPSSVVILWQIGIVGDLTFKTNGYPLPALPLLLERLYRFYRPDHVAYVYVAAVFPGCEPLIQPVPLHALPHSGLPAVATLCIPPGQPPRPVTPGLAAPLSLS